MQKTATKNRSKKTSPVKSPLNPAINDTLRLSAFDKSLQANIITIASNGNILIANKAACKLFGYSMKELLTKSRSVIFDITESSFKKMLKERTIGGQSHALVTAIKKGGHSFACEITSAVFTDTTGIKKAITTIADMREGILKQKNIDTKKEKIVSDNILRVQSEQKKTDSKNEKIVAENIILVQSKQKKTDIQKEKIVTGNIVLAKSKQKKIDRKKEQVVAANVKLAIAKSEEEKSDLEINVRNQVLTEIEEHFRAIFKSSSEVLFDSDLISNIVMINDAYEKEFGYSSVSNDTATEDWTHHIHPDEKVTVLEDYAAMLASDAVEWKYSFRFLRADNTVANVLSKGIVLRDFNGVAYRRIGYLLDISRQTVLEERLAQEIN